MIPSHVYMQENSDVSERRHRINPLVNYRNYTDYSYLLELDLLQFMGIEMPPVRRCGYPPNRSGNCHWREHAGHQQKGISLIPPPLIVPYCRNSVFFCTSFRRSVQNNKELSRHSSDSCLEGSLHSDSEFSLPLPRKQTIPEIGDNNGADDSSEDSFPSSASEGGKGVKRIHGFHKRDYHQTGNYQHHRNLNSQRYQGKRRHDSGRHSPPRYNSIKNSQSENNKNNIYADHSQGQPRNNYGRRLFVPGSHHHGHPHHIPPDRFLAKADSVEVVNIPSQLTDGSEWDKLSQSIWAKFTTNQQTADTFRRKITLWRNLFIYIRTNFPRYGLFLVGSTMSGFGSNNSDVDMCLLVRHSEMDQRNEAVCHLEQVLKYLRRCEFVDKVELIQAKVPILKFQGLGLEVDLNCNNAVGIRNTHLLYCYSQMDWRVRPLVLLIKLWASAHDINDAKNMTVSSYSLVLMVIHFLQCGVNPSVLPCLHELYNDKFSPHSDISHIDLHEELPVYESENKQPIGLLLLEFLRYYAQFDFNTHAISVRIAGKIPIEDCRRARSYKNDPHQWKYLCIEEPFDLTNTARSVYDHSTFERIKSVFVDSFEKLKKTRSLESIFDLQSN